MSRVIPYADGNVGSGPGRRNGNDRCHLQKELDRSAERHGVDTGNAAESEPESVIVINLFPPDDEPPPVPRPDYRAESQVEPDLARAEGVDVPEQNENPRSRYLSIMILDEVP